jgi:hypothetical protein
MKHESAFPIVGNADSHLLESYGLTIRDYFAAHALASIVHDFVSPGIEDEGTWCNWVARVSYQVADAMIEIREQSNG